MGGSGAAESEIPRTGGRTASVALAGIGPTPVCDIPRVTPAGAFPRRKPLSAERIS